MKLLNIFEKIKRKRYAKIIYNYLYNNKELPNKIKVAILKRAIKELRCFMCIAIDDAILYYTKHYIAHSSIKILIPKFNRKYFDEYAVNNNFPISIEDSSVWTVGLEPRISFLNHLIKEYETN